VRVVEEERGGDLGSRPNTSSCMDDRTGEVSRPGALRDKQGLGEMSATRNIEIIIIKYRKVNKI
jgi:hypothetical protein